MEIDIQAFEAQLYREVYGTPAPWETEFDAFDAQRLIAHHDDLTPWERPVVPSYEEVEDEQPTPTPEPEVQQPAQEPRVRRRGRAPRVIEGIMVGGVDADALWTAYAEANPECASLRQRRTKFASFCEWCRDGGEALDAGTLDRYASDMLERGVSKASIAVYLCYVRAVLRHGIATGLLPDGVAPKRRAGRRKTASRHVLPYIEARRCLPYLGDMQNEAASAARIKRKKKSYKKRFLADLFRLDADFTTADVRRSYRKLAVYLHPDHGGDAEKMRALTDAFTWLTTDLQASVYKLTIWIARSGHALVEAFSREIYERIGGYEVVDALWERIDAQQI